MTGKVHVTIGVASLGLFCLQYPHGFEFAGSTVYPAVGLVTAAFGSYLPDIDMERTHMGSQHKITSKVVNKVGGGHRGITHTLLVPAIIALLMYLIGTKLYIPFITASFANIVISGLMSILFGVEYGYCMHIFADMFNGKGCPILWPIVRKKIPGILDLPSEGFGAWAFAVILIFVQAGLLFTIGGLSDVISRFIVW